MTENDNQLMEKDMDSQNIMADLDAIVADVRKRVQRDNVTIRWIASITAIAVTTFAYYYPDADSVLKSLVEPWFYGLVILLFIQFAGWINARIEILPDEVIGAIASVRVKDIEAFEELQKHLKRYGALSIAAYERFAKKERRARLIYPRLNSDGAKALLLKAPRDFETIAHQHEQKSRRP